MSHDTFEENQRRCQLDEGDEIWLFGYGSLIYLADFPYLDAKPASIKGWSRRFWQGSHDHRGTETNPGRVVTLIEDNDVVCHGMAYNVEASVFEQLDVREKNGYLRFSTEMTFANGSSDQGLVYIATADNAAYLGEASEYDIAVQIANSEGPSGTNSDYIIDLANSLRDMGIDDPHVFGIVRHLEQFDST